MSGQGAGERDALHARLRATREARGLSYRQAAEQIGCTPSTVHKIEHGGDPRWSVVQRVLAWIEGGSRRAALLAEIQKGQQAGGHEPSAEALDLARQVLEGRLDVGVVRAALTARYSRVIPPASTDAAGEGRES